MKVARLKERAARLKDDIPAVFLAIKHKNTPAGVKMLAVVTVCFALSPVDLIPDFIPVLGYLDDLIILPALIALIIRLIPEQVFAECRERGAARGRDQKDGKWYFAIPFVLIWLFIILLIIKAVLR